MNLRGYLEAKKFCAGAACDAHKILIILAEKNARQVWVCWKVITYIMLTSAALFQINPATTTNELTVLIHCLKIYDE